MRSIALIDCNNFYANCERVFRPDLAHSPILILSNNDGAIVSRSNEAKALGFKMGEPFFTVRDLAKHHKVSVFSSNYALYADISNRIMTILAQFSPVQEVYSIDESFLDLTGFTDIANRAVEIRRRVLAYTAIPVCVGIGPSKTLAKLMNFVAKRHPKSQGIFDYNRLTEHQIDSVLSNIPIAEIWGIGRRLNKSLSALGIETARQLRDANAAAMRARFGVVMEKTVRELRGVSCIAMEEIAPPKKQIVSSRSFGCAISDLADLESAVAHFVSNAAVKLRSQKSVASMLQVFIMTDRFRQDQPQYCPSMSIPLSMPTADTMTLQHWAVQCLQSMYKEGFQYRKAGIMLSDISPESAFQADMFSAAPTNSQLMQTLDAINLKFGKGTLTLSSDGASKNWAMRQDRKSPGYTTEWEQMPVCR
jgi:DNA polymerase V